MDKRKAGPEESSYDRLPELVKWEITLAVMDGRAVESSGLALAAIERAQKVQRDTPWLALLMVVCDVAGMAFGTWMADRTDPDASLYSFAIVGGILLPIFMGPVAYLHGMAKRSEARNRRLIAKAGSLPDSAGGFLIRIGQLVLAFCAAFSTLWLAGLFVSWIFIATAVRPSPFVTLWLSSGFLLTLMALYYRLLSS